MLFLLVFFFLISPWHSLTYASHYVRQRDGKWFPFIFSGVGDMRTSDHITAAAAATTVAERTVTEPESHTLTASARATEDRTGVRSGGEGGWGGVGVRVELSRLQLHCYKTLFAAHAAADAARSRTLADSRWDYNLWGEAPLVDEEMPAAAQGLQSSRLTLSETSMGTCVCVCVWARSQPCVRVWVGVYVCVSAAALINSFFTTLRVFIDHTPFYSRNTPNQNRFGLNYWIYSDYFNLHTPIWGSANQTRQVRASCVHSLVLFFCFFFSISNQIRQKKNEIFFKNQFGSLDHHHH